MITSVRLVNFKNFVDETLRVGPFTIIVGANASGKSNIRDAFRFLHGIGRGYSLTEILGGKYGEGGYLEWTNVRGAPSEIPRLEMRYPSDWATFTVIAKFSFGNENKSYSIEIGFHANSGFVVLQESLETESGLLFTTLGTNNLSNFNVRVGDQGKVLLRGLDRTRPILSQFSEHVRTNLSQFSDIDPIPYTEVAFQVQTALLRARFLEPSPERMRYPSFPGLDILGDRGEYLPSVLEALCADVQRKKTLMSWLQELTPMDVKDFEFPRDPSGLVHLRIVEGNGRKLSSYSVSDGTLRFLGLLAALLSPIEGVLYFFEEIDNGIHPSRLHLLIDLIERQTATSGIQVITTTHSPDVLNLINDTAFKSTSVVYRDEASADAIIRPVAELPNARELRKSQGLGRLLSGAWMETALAFTEGGYDEDSEDE